ncbi:hypothetical protein BMS3Abin10_00553 [bacterium BMS3Abin10]|nr:hypothetical protein BMS3Abin10_00553 [bacterium BMS3Abin10]
MSPTIKVHSFTADREGIVNVLKTKVSVSIGFDYSKTPVRPSPKEFVAIWDTGATNSAITKEVVNECGLKPIGMVQVHHANGVAMQPVYIVNISLPNKVEFREVKVTEGTLGGCDVLVGMDIICAGDFAVTNKDGKTTFSYRYPSIERIDFVNQRPPGSSSVNKPLLGKKIGRNDPCSCGSGKKYKKCCGT